MRAASLIFLLVLALTARGQNAASPAQATPTATAAPQAEMMKWLASLDAGWQGTFKQEVTAPCDAELAKLRQQYRALVDAKFAKASSAGDLDLTVAWRAERDRLAASNDVPEQDEVSDPAPIKAARATYREQAGRLARDRAARAKAIYARYDQLLAQAQTQLTQKQRIEDALLVKTQRERLAKDWLGDAATSPAMKADAPEHAVKPVLATPRPVAATPISSKLTIVSAQYGESSSNRMVDITEHLQKVLASGQPTLKLNTRDGAEGKDPAPTARKETVITYSIHGRTKTKTIPESDELNFKADLK